MSGFSQIFLSIRLIACLIGERVRFLFSFIFIQKCNLLNFFIRQIFLFDNQTTMIKIRNILRIRSDSSWNKGWAKPLNGRFKLSLHVIRLIPSMTDDTVLRLSVCKSWNLLIGWPGPGHKLNYDAVLDLPSRVLFQKWRKIFDVLIFFFACAYE